MSIPAIKYLRPETKTKMLTLNRPRRSVLYMPASNPRVLEKAKGLAADTLIFDLEDAVAPDAKSAARDAAVAAVASNDYGHRECLIRVNALDTQWGEDDLKAAASSKTDGVIIPKVSAPDEMAQVDDVLTRCGAADDFPLWAMMETARGVWAANDIARSSNRLVGFCAGTADLAKDLHCTHPADRAPMLTALQLIVLAARVNGFAVLDGVHVDLNDEAGFAMVCRQGRDFGFDGKTLIHPKQIAVANETFAPSADDIVHAQRLIEAHGAAQAKGAAVTTLDGHLVEVLHVQQAEHLLAKAEAISAMTNQG